jgi:hypothetical protein
MLGKHMLASLNGGEMLVLEKYAFVQMIWRHYNALRGRLK